MSTIRAAVVQLDSGRDLTANLQALRHWVRAAAHDGAQFIVTPEYTDVRGNSQDRQRQAAAVPGRVTEFVASLARENQVYIQIGSLHERIVGESRLGDTGVTVSPAGEIIATYRKTHLYDANINSTVYRESSEFIPGDSVQTVCIGAFRVGLSICYDVRFPELYRALRAKDANVLVVAAAFNVHTGRDHWESLLRARAIENQCYVLAAAQIGGPGPDMPCFGRSMIVDPWGTVIACMPDTTGYVCAELDTERVVTLRKSLPAWRHRRDDVTVHLNR